MTEYISILQGYIDHLEYMNKFAYGFFDREQANKDIEAFKAAIKALEQEPCDAVSREAAIKHLTKARMLGDSRPMTEIFAELPPVNPQYTEDEIQKMQNLEQAEIEKAYELGKVEGQKSEVSE